MRFGVPTLNTCPYPSPARAPGRAVGAQPTPMAFGEVFTSLQTGVIEAQENPLALIKSASFFEVQKYVNKTEHVRS